jgi:hypothetical protein
MPPRHSRLTLVGIPLFAICLSGCAARSVVRSTYPPFQLQTVEGASSLLLTPAVERNTPDNSPLELQQIAPTKPNSSAENCSIRQGPFQLQKNPAGNHSLLLTLPPREDWLYRLEGQADSDNVNLFDSLDAFLADLGKLQTSGCIQGSVGDLRDSILQSLPTAPNQSLLNVYGYRFGRSSINLKPSLRLKVERAYFQGEENIEDPQSPVKNFKGLSWSYFDLKEDSSAKLSFQRAGPIQFSPASLAHTDAEGKLDLALSSLPPHTYYRLFFHSLTVPTNRKRSATIMGGESAAQLDAVEAKLRAKPAESCEEAAANPDISCFEFRGFVTASVEVRVTLNGKTYFLEWGTNVRQVLANATDMSKVLKTLRIQRTYKDGYSDVLFDSAKEDILSLVLVGGDRLTWSGPAPATAPKIKPAIAKEP